MSDKLPGPGVCNAQLRWDEDGQPISSVFGDVYFSKANGLEETRHVFLHHNQLRERWRALAENSHFTIAETGFGSGLNFLAAWDLWLQVAPPSAQLHFVTVEKFPLLKADLIRALALWPALQQLTQPLVTAYPDFVGSGFHRLQFMGGRIRLTLIIDDAAAGFTQLLATTHPLFERSGPKVDAWFLDGFAPAKNSAMWSDELFSVIGKLSHSQTTAATFSAAAIVKHGLRNAGFDIQKVPGFGRKREMIKAFYVAIPEQPDAEQFSNRRSYSPYPVPWTIPANKAVFKQKNALVIGGGLAGCHTARALAERGWKVTLLERRSTLASEASGNVQGALYAKLSPLDEAQAAFNLSSLQYALHYYRPLWETIGAACGVLQLAYKKSELELQRQLHEKFLHAGELVQFVNAHQASALANIQLEHSGLFFPQAGWINPRQLCVHLTDHPAIEIVTDTHVSNIEYASNQWQVQTDDKHIYNAPALVIANAQDALKFTQTSHFPLQSIRGQITCLPALGDASSLKTVVCAEGYIGPAHNGFFYTGATFNLKDTNTQVTIRDHQTNLDNLHEHLPAIAQAWEGIDITGLAGRVGFRCSLPDYLPLVGPVPDVDKMTEDFAPLRKNARAGITVGGSYLPGLYINVGHGARGLAYTPLCAELLAAQINDEILPLPTGLVTALNPARFIIRDLIRNKR